MVVRRAAAHHGLRNSFDEQLIAFSGFGGYLLTYRAVGPTVEIADVKTEGRGEMIKTPIDLQDLRRRLYVKAKTEPSWRFWGIHVHVCKIETLSLSVYRKFTAGEAGR
jgi:hypothetical protein